jgi:hypothetical protein
VKAIFLQKLAHEFQRGALVPFRLNQHIEDLALGVTLKEDTLEAENSFLRLSRPPTRSAHIIPIFPRVLIIHGMRATAHRCQAAGYGV